MRWILVMVMLARSVGAQPSADDPVRRADEAMHRGMEATARGDHTAALAAFRDAAALVPDANLPHKLAGEALEALGNTADAIAEYERYVAINPDARGAEDVRARIERLKKLLPVPPATLDVRCSVRDAMVVVDGASAGAPPLTLAHVPGAVTVEISAPGHRRQLAHVELTTGERTQLDCDLAREEIEARVEPPVHVRARVTAPTPWYRRWSVIIPAVAVASLAATFGAYEAFDNRIPNSDGGAHHFP